MKAYFLRKEYFEKGLPIRHLSGVYTRDVAIHIAYMSLYCFEDLRCHNRVYRIDFPERSIFRNFYIFVSLYHYGTILESKNKLFLQVEEIGFDKNNQLLVELYYSEKLNMQYQDSPQCLREPFLQTLLEKENDHESRMKL